MEESVSGFSVEGSWADVVELGERVTRALRDLREEGAGRDGDDEGDSDVDVDLDGEAFQQWEEWRPKLEERVDQLNEKTAEQAAVDEGEGEQKGKSPDEDIKKAGEKLSDSYERLEDDADPDRAVEDWRESVGYVARAADSAGRKALRAVEGVVYRNVMTQMSPYYFDSELVSANLGRAREEGFRFEVNVNDDDLKIRVSNRLADYEQSVDRWHVDTQPDTEALEAVEGGENVDVPETDADANPTTN
jgi:hypothetical protein